MAHIPQNSVIPEQGSTIRRGSQIARVGEVGQAIGGSADRTVADHLHWATSSHPWNRDESKIPAYQRGFRKRADGTFEAMDCTLPKRGEVWAYRP